MPSHDHVEQRTSSMEQRVDAIQAALRDWAHHLRMYAWGNCTCHQVLGKR